MHTIFKYAIKYVICTVKYLFRNENKDSSRENPCLESTVSILTPIELQGKRVIDISHFLQQVKLMDSHGPFGCSFANMDVISESRKGLNSCIKFRCSMCNIEKNIWTNDTASKMGINTAAVSGTIGIGIGFSNMQEFFSSMDIPSLSVNTYLKEHEKVSDAWEECAVKEMMQAVEEEKVLAIQRGDVDQEGIPLFTVIVDGTWSKRSYKTNYSSLSGAVST